MEKDVDKLALSLAGNLSADQTREKWLERQERFKPSETVATTEAGRLYLENLWKEDKNAKVGKIYVRQKQEMEYGEARRKVWALMELRAAHISDLEGKPFEWDMSPDFAAAVRLLTKYFVNDPTCECSLSKGLFVYGLPGTGKTELMHIFERFTRENELSKAFHFSSLSKIYTDAKANADFDPVAPNVCFSRCFDEFGRYLGAVKRYGDDLDINEAILEQRYDRFKRYGQLTHLIANLTPNETETKFSPMLYDRIRSMCTGVYFKGESKRK